MNKAIITLLFALIGLGAWAQTFTVTGTVTSSDDGEPLAGATIKVRGKSTATAADIDGHYTITVSGKEAVLDFSYVGYTPAERKVKQGGVVDVVMSPDSGMLDEVVVIGYGAVKKSDLTGSVSSVNADKLTKTPAASLSNALQGQVAGVTVNSLTGRPGASAEVRIRGVGTINGASPIYVVDGVIADDIDFLSPNDIEHIEVLKDASATAIYGARGANGVIIVTTKAGGFSTPTHISFNGYVGVQQRWKKLDVMNAKDYADTYLAINGNAAMKKYYDQQGLNGFLYMFQQLRSSEFHAMPQVSSQPNGFDYTTVDTDWQDEVFRNGLIQNYHLSIDGGSDKVSYSMSGSWFGQEGIIIGSDYTRFTGRINTTFKAFPWLKVGENISFMSSVAKNAYESGDNSISAGASIISAAFAMAPWDPVRYPEGTFNSKGESLAGGLSAGSMFKNVTNPYSMVEYSHPKVNSDRLVGNVFFELLPVRHLTFRSTYSFDYRLTR
ncbi:MAG: SusC/RagA family TonB-linked outer membrane protein, partial [Muribaculaceae bacterium]|nr:SusC/RagA family TonB-linked outer membrane protein [Muribaculaceae bacterium]